tara:strand:+ start:723 stop:1001 length:279 start_codon:yes stop_codon:yes gene_type:complete
LIKKLNKENNKLLQYMQNLPIEMNYEIGKYLFSCKKYPLYINKEFTDIFKYVTRKCTLIKNPMFKNKTICCRCDGRHVTGHEEGWREYKYYE